MRIIAGRWANRDLTSPGGRVRPTAEPVRDLCLHLVRHDLDDARVLDLFAGTGALGLEALSRGAARCDFVENGPAALHSLKANVAALRVRKRSRVFDRDAIPFVHRLPAGAYDIAFADPPYGSKKLDRVVERWLEAPFARVLCLEHAPDHELPLKGMTRRLEESAVTLLRSRT
ncbi:MAG: RsmD family RNA methyltransferase [Gemmatimonadota bacterium]|jgi:16S rRNA (guanine966-N2)-methyltransferase